MANTWNFEGTAFKKCPKCDKGIPANWKQHYAPCGWKSDIADDPEGQMDLIASQMKKERIIDSSSDFRQKEIMLGQSFNLALRQGHWLRDTNTTEQFEDQFKSQAKKFFKLMQEVKQEAFESEK